jgi:hypothetical protein
MHREEVMEIEIKLGDKVTTPRFLSVRIAAMFENIELAETCGFTETTHFREDSEYDIRGKHIGVNLMLFAAVKRDKPYEKPE